MFFMTNNENSIIAADIEFIQRVNAKTILDITVLINKGDLILNGTEQSIILYSDYIPFKRIKLSTFFGDAYLYDLSTNEDNTNEENPLIQSEKTSNLTQLQHNIMQQETNPNISKSDIQDNEIIPLIEEETENTNHSNDPSKEEEQLFEIKDGIEDITLPDNTNLTDEEIETKTEKFAENESCKEVPTQDTEDAESTLDAYKQLPQSEKFDKNADLSCNEHIKSIEEFQVQASYLDSDLRGHDFIKSKDAITSLTKVSQLLNLSDITEKLHELLDLTYDEKEEHINHVMSMIAHLNTSKSIDIIKQDSNNELTEAANTERLNLDIKAAETDQAHSAESQKSMSSQANLSDITPAIMNFNIEKSAKELALPVSLLHEFLVDFINRAQENLLLLQEAYDNRNINLIKQIAHTLKNSSDHLNVTFINNTLDNLYLNDNLTKVPEIIKKFKSQLKGLSMEIQMD